MKIFIALISCCCISFASAQSITCFTNAKQINIGDTASQVIDTCGKPDKTITDTINKVSTHPVTHWYYLVQFLDQLSNEDQTYPSSTMIKIAIEFYQDKVDHINVLVPLGINEDHSAYNMLGYLISKGADEQHVQLLLGQPTTISQDTVTETEEIEVTSALVYHDSDTNQQQTLQFEENKLVSNTASEPAADTPQ